MKTKPRTYSLLDEMFASPITPMPLASQRYTMMGYLEAMAAIKLEPDPSEHHWRVLADAVNLAESLIEMGELQDNDGLIRDAVQAMGRTALRYQEGGPLRLDGDALKAMTALVDDMGEVVATLPHRTMIRAHRYAEKRVRDINEGKRKPGDVVISVLQCCRSRSSCRDRVELGLRGHVISSHRCRKFCRHTPP